MQEIVIRQALKVLLSGPCPTKDFVSRAVGEDRAKFKKPLLINLGAKLKKRGLVRLLDGSYYITDEGKALAGEDTKVRGTLISKTGGEYTCPELGRTCHRAGAYDFLDIPSKFGNELRSYQFKSGVN